MDPPAREAVGDPLALSEPGRFLIEAAIAELDAALSQQMTAILRSPSFQALEAAWRSLERLVQESARSPLVTVMVLPVAWREVVRDVERAADIEHTTLFRMIYEERFDRAGETPFGLIIGDYEISHAVSSARTTDDVGALSALAAIGAAAYCPLVLGAHPSLLGAERFADLRTTATFDDLFRGATYLRWRRLRTSPDTRFIGLTSPRVVLRGPWERDPYRGDGFDFEERPERGDDDGHLWGNAAFAFGQVVMRAYVETGFFADIRGAPLDVVGGGIIPTSTKLCFATEPPGVAAKTGLDCRFTSAQERELAAGGVMTVRPSPYTDLTVFYVSPSLEAPRAYDRAQADVSAQMSCQLQYVLCVARFAHCIKIMGRQRIASTESPEACEAFLNRWLNDKYCEGSDSASPRAKTVRPLKTARVKVTDRGAGRFMADILLRPHAQIDGIAPEFTPTLDFARGSRSA